MRKFVVFALWPRNIDALAVKVQYAIGAQLQSLTKRRRIGLQVNKWDTVQTVIQSSLMNQTSQVKEVKCHHTRQDYPQ